ncbi:Zn-ribbon domain-containing OB-fold protein [Henriciella mobilis]|uniref:Zn-ribbon domain-containing OB-fold protein n=1 Tax=Henriciella mobilis TaxID=2305467 RepID=UPI000E661BB0|nr:Zn-ribbon domain-containing OB-fold protein [Henriciella mobilis]RIJ22409.1 Zn-ribbon domain-containing OB-fold protein [Henriciella mobilis]
MSLEYGPAQLLPGDKIAISTDTSTEPFWQMAKEKKLTACQCAKCGHFRMPPTPYCPECQSREMNWPELPGTATVFSFAICTRSPYSGEPLIYVPVVVDLDGAPGARLVSNLVGIDAEKVEIGMKVKVDWNPIQDGWLLPVFRPV